MLDRLKSLPLTIILTILIWMYAESQFTATQEGLPVTLSVAATSRYNVEVLDKQGDGKYHPSVPLHITIEGPKSQVERLYQEAIRVLPQDPEFRNLVCEVNAEDLHVGTDLTLETVPMLNQTGFFRRRGVTVVAAIPARVQLSVTERQKEETLALPEIVVGVLGPPAVMRAFDVVTEPRVLKLTVAGSTAALAGLKAAVAKGTVGQQVQALLDVRGRPAGTARRPARRALRYVLPDGVRVVDGPADVGFRLVPRKTP